MTAAPRIADISSYLSATGWQRTPETWRGAAIWSSGQTDVLVPPTDDMGDADLRIRELLADLAATEARDPADIARDIGSPFVDSTTYRAGELSLPAAADVVDGLRRAAHCLPECWPFHQRPASGSNTCHTGCVGSTCPDPRASSVGSRACTTVRTSRWRVRIRGELHTDRAISGSRGVWVRMPGQRLYDLAIAGHQTGRLVRVTGFREGATARQDLAVPPDGLEILDELHQ